jgi:hypothetical protein
VWAVVERFADLEGGQPAVSKDLAYALFDGLFQNSLIRHLRGDADAAAALQLEAPALLRSAVLAA